MSAVEAYSHNESQELTKDGKPVGETDRVYPLDGKSEVVFNEILVKGDLAGELEYNGYVIQIEEVDDFVGLERGPRGLRGPLWKGVTSKVIRKVA